MDLDKKLSLALLCGLVLNSLYFKYSRERKSVYQFADAFYFILCFEDEEIKFCNYHATLHILLELVDVDERLDGVQTVYIEKILQLIPFAIVIFSQLQHELSFLLPRLNIFLFKSKIKKKKNFILFALN